MWQKRETAQEYMYAYIYINYVTGAARWDEKKHKTQEEGRKKVKWKANENETF